ncbi:MAG: carbon-phosphorus lyase complex subunit PhnI [Gammaproteobacteria bacterium]|nr:carbon-phosphorus lyase complex subunit PhnI [Gammaproteobacteria bacterium]
MYVAVKGGEKAIDNAHRLLAEQRRGDNATPELSVEQIESQLSHSVDRVMTEGGLYDRELASLAIKQAAGDMLEAIFLLRAYRTTLCRFYTAEPLDTGSLRAERWISAIFKDIPGGQLLGATFDYTHRLLDFALLADGETSTGEPPASTDELPDGNDLRVMSMLEEEALLVRENGSGVEPDDITTEPLSYPASRSARLQMLARGDEGFLLSMAYSTQRGYGRNHPFAGEIRLGELDVSVVPPELGFEIVIGCIEIAECEMINGFTETGDVDGDRNLRFTRGYGLVFGHAERKAMAMALMDRALQADDYDEERSSPAQQEEFVLSHCDNVEAAGFVSHLKLPHYVDFQSELELLRRLRGKRRQGDSDEGAA